MLRYGTAPVPVVVICVIFKSMMVDPVCRKKISDKGLTMRVVSDLMSPFEGLNHCDNFYTSGPLIEMFANKKKIS